MFNDLPFTSDPFASWGKATSDGRRTTDDGQNSDDVIATTTTAASVRNAQELQARIKASSGAIRTNANSSDYIVAANNRLKFSIVQLSNGQYEIRESQYYWLVIGAAALVGVLLITKK